MVLGFCCIALAVGAAVTGSKGSRVLFCVFSGPVPDVFIPAPVTGADCCCSSGAIPATALPGGLLPRISLNVSSGIMADY